MIVDSHCHLDLIEAKGYNIDEIVADASSNNVKILQTISTKVSQYQNLKKYTDKYSNVYASIGNHPCNVKEEGVVSPQQIMDLCNNDQKVIGIGETGLDYFHDTSFVDQQKQSFLNHIIASQETQLPLIIHSRDCDIDMIDILQREQANKKFPALLHCFSSSKELAQKAIELGIYISFSGIVTFKNAKLVQQVAKEVPEDMILVETDSPYLAPTPYRGQDNKPAYTANTLEFLANLRGVDKDYLAKITTNNFFNIFNKAAFNH